MEINFKPITLSDKAAVSAVLLQSESRFCELTFGNLFCWGAFFDNMLFCDGETLVTGDVKKARFSVPLGKNRTQAMDILVNEFGAKRFTSLSKEDIALFDDRFEITQNKNYNDYIYLSESLRELKGKKLASKRNHINAFTADGEWNIKPITQSDIETILSFNKKWCKNYCGEIKESLGLELCATRRGLENFEKLGFVGLMLYKNGQLCAYSYGEPINHDTFCVHVEKADQSVRGAYQMINREFARTFCADFLYINREDDAGDEGLKRAKLSYYPTDLGIKYTATLK